jgi:hypothetical protein
VQVQRAPRRWPVPAIAAAAAVLVTLGIARMGTGPAEDPAHLKGVARGTLEILAVQPGAAPTALAADAVVELGGTLAFRVALDVPTCVQLVEEASAHREITLPTPLCLEAGRHAIARDGVVLGRPLDAAGTLTFVLEDDASHVLDTRRVIVRERRP